MLARIYSYERFSIWVISLRETLGVKSSAAYSGRSQAVYAALAEVPYLIFILLSIPSNHDFTGDLVGSTIGHSMIRAYNAEQARCFSAVRVFDLRENGAYSIRAR